MIEITGTVKEITSGEDADSIVIIESKRRSKIKIYGGGFESYSPGEKVTVVIEKEKTLFDKKE